MAKEQAEKKTKEKRGKRTVFWLIGMILIGGTGWIGYQKIMDGKETTWEKEEQGLTDKTFPQFLEEEAQQNLRGQDPAPNAPEAQETIGELEDETETIKQQIKLFNQQITQINTRLDTLESYINRPKEQSLLLLSLIHLKEAVEEERPFEVEWKTAMQVASPYQEMVRILGALEPLSAGRIESIATLTQELKEHIKTIKKENLTPTQNQWLNKIIQNISTLVTVQRVDGQSNGSLNEDLDQMVVLMETKEMEQVLKKMQGLPEDIQKQLEQWQAKVKAHAQVYNQIDQIINQSLRHY